MTATRTITLELNEKELALLTHALRAFLSDFGHDEPDVIEAIRSALAKLTAAANAAPKPVDEVTAAS